LIGFLSSDIMSVTKNDATTKKSAARQFSRYGMDNTTEEMNVNALMADKRNLLQDLERRQETYVARERAFKTKIDELEEELKNQRQEKTGWMKSDAKIEKLKSMQAQIVKNVELVQDRTSRVLQEQERDLLRAFRARLFDVQTELEKERSKKEDGAGAWIERCRKLESEVEWAKESADRLERVNQTLLTDNGRLKSRFASQEEDRDFLIQQLVNAKKENTQLKAEFAAVESENVQLREQLKALEEAAANMNMMSPARHVIGKDGAIDGVNNIDVAAMPNDERYKEINARLRRLLAEERKALQHLRANYAQELKSRTEMETLLRQCVEDVRKEIARRTYAARSGTASSKTRGNSTAPGTAQSSGGGAVGAANIPVSSFTQSDRERTLELLLSRERVISLIYAKTFPIATASSSFSNPLSKSSSALHPSGMGTAANEEILRAISVGRAPNSTMSRDRDAGFYADKMAEGPGNGSASYDGFGDEQELSVSEGGGGPLIAAALKGDDTSRSLDLSKDGVDGAGTRLPALR
jgi:hypothetical protein